MSYVDGYVLPVPKKHLKVYQRLAAEAGKVWKEHGALDYKECAGEDLKIKGMVPFTKLMNSKPNETVVFAYVVFKSRKHRDAVNKKVMNDPRIKSIDPSSMPFDFRRMAYGGFDVIVDPKGRSKPRK